MPLSWAEADRQFYASAAGKAYLAAATMTGPSSAPSSSAAPAPSVVRPSIAYSEQAGTQPAEALPARPVPPVPAPTPLAKKAAKRRFTSQGAEIHHLLSQGACRMWSKHVSRQWEVLSGAERVQFDRDEGLSSAPTPAPTIAPGSPSPPEVSFGVSLRELTDLADLPDEDTVAALTGHLVELRRIASRPILPNEEPNARGEPPTKSIQEHTQEHSYLE